jgi:catalase
MVADGVDGATARAIHAGLAAEGALPRYVGARLGAVQADEGDALEVDATFETMPSVLFDALAVPGGKSAVQTLANIGHALEFIKDQYRHAKPILALGAACDLLEGAGVSPVLPSGAPDPGLIVERQPKVAKLVPAFVQAVAKHRHHDREMDPPEV